MSNKTLATAVALVAIAGVTAGFTPESADVVLKLFSEAAQSQIAQTGFFFTVAAWLHAGRVKKEIRENFASLTLAIDKVADAFREDLKVQGARLDNLALRVTSLEEKTIKGE